MLKAKEIQTVWGFTLVELAIVLVIIGLIVGGILVGTDLIASAEVRSQISQISKINTAAHAFRTKYNGLPGDLPTAANFGFVARGTLAGEGDGNGIIEARDCCTVRGYAQGGGETRLFWRDLGEAGFIDEGTFSSATVANTTIAATALQNYFPAAKIGKNNFVYVWSGGFNVTDGLNYLTVGGIDLVASGWQLQTGTTNQYSMRVSQAQAIDTKLDDGWPLAGNITTLRLNGGASYSANTSGNGGSTRCSDNPNGNRFSSAPGGQGYATDVNADGTTCSLTFKAQF